MSKQTKKAKQWTKALKRLEKEAIANGIFEWKEFEIEGKKYRKRMGICCDCGKYKALTPDHLIRRSQGGSNESKNIEWPCLQCHHDRDQRGDPLKKKPPPKNSKTLSWKRRHPCKHCGKWTIGLLCPSCGKISL